MENSNTVIPLLRFLGFSGKWKRKKIKDITAPAGRKNKQNHPYERYSISNETGFYPQADQFEDGGGYLKDIDCRQYIIVPPKSFAYNPARINVGSIGYQNIGKEVIVSSLYEVFQTNDEVDDRFLWQWFHTDVFHKMVLNVQEGGVRQYFFYDKLKECTIYLPSPDEQKKIAECLEAIDQMISAQNQKVESLKAHKKGLMQQLFPQPGATTPVLRFPGFTGEWQEKPLSHFLHEHKTKSDGKCEVHSVSVAKGVINQVEYLGRSFAASDTSKYNLAKPGDIIYTKSPTGAFPYGIVKQNKNPYNVIVSPLYAVYTPVNQYVGYILDSYFESSVNTNNYLSSLIQKGAKNTIQISNDTFVSKSMCLPSDPAEQQKIAECLETLDNLIAAESKKLESLKTHKKGLMQQLFPQPVK